MAAETSSIVNVWKRRRGSAPVYTQNLVVITLGKILAITYLNFKNFLLIPNNYFKMEFFIYPPGNL